MHNHENEIRAITLRLANLRRERATLVGWAGSTYEPSSSLIAGLEARLLQLNAWTYEPSPI